MFNHAHLSCSEQPGQHTESKGEASWDTVDPVCERTDSVSTGVQNARDQVTEPVNIADACDLHWSEHSLPFQFEPKGLPLKSALLWQLHQPLLQKKKK